MMVFLCPSCRTEMNLVTDGQVAEPGKPPQHVPVPVVPGVRRVCGDSDRTRGATMGEGEDS